MPDWQGPPNRKFECKRFATAVLQSLEMTGKNSSNIYLVRRSTSANQVMRLMRRGTN